MAKIVPFHQPGQPVNVVDRFAAFVENAAAAPAPDFFSLLDNFIEETYADGTAARWKAEKEARQQRKKPLRGYRYDRSAIMKAAWGYRKGRGLSMSESLKRAWAEAKGVFYETA
jgi:hypothetical protein